QPGAPAADDDASSVAAVDAGSGPAGSPPAALAVAAAGSTALDPIGAAASNGTSVRIERRRRDAGVVGGIAISERKPEWLRIRAHLGEEYTGLGRTLRSLDLVTVCEEAGCPNIFECW